MAWTFAALKAADAALGIADTTQAAAGINAQTTTSAAVNVAWASIRDVLMNNFDWGSLVQVAQTAIGGTLPGGGTQTVPIQAAAVAIHECCIYGGTFGSSDATVWGRLTTAAGRLTPAAVGGISSASAAAVTALRTPTIPVWSPAVTPGDIQTARSQP